ncbi:hypothetical protein M5X06_22445 [Paenibacillus alvei]|uniref:Uncharacterized protein n=1 Tax=Paenibacillus alvei TaxID=44250 RepID=A0ABT4H2I4_PAEAL|nr:hypothetical protein [Paenibacillus alvei]MCY9763159.1 hypothetical protein [Paenibacillus alvei]MCY9769550.1 hypothetical protein [Paenibacillus alvei]
MKKIKIYNTLLALNVVLPFLSGVFAYYMADQIIFSQTMHLDELYYPSFLAGIFYLIMVLPLSWFTCYAIDKHFRLSAMKLILCPIMCSVIGILPVAVISAGRIFEPFAQLFLAFFIILGLVFGFLFLIRIKVEKYLQI